MKPSKLVFWLTLSGVTLIVVIFVAYLYLVEKSPLTFQEMDFNQNGYVTFFELIYANSHGTRAIILDDTSCIEYYSLKDGVRLKLDCEIN